MLDSVLKDLPAGRNLDKDPYRGNYQLDVKTVEAREDKPCSLLLRDIRDDRDDENQQEDGHPDISSCGTLRERGRGLQDEERHAPSLRNDGGRRDGEGEDNARGEGQGEEGEGRN